MSTATPAALITAEEFAEMQFDHPVELVRGEIVEMGQPDLRHGTICLNIGMQLQLFGQATRLGRAACNDSGVVTERNPDTVREADVVFVRTELLVDGRMPAGATELVPDLCVEVLSRHDRWPDVRRKIDEYLDRGVSEVWIARPDQRTLEVFLAGEPSVTHAEGDELTSRTLPGFACRVGEFFEGV